MRIGHVILILALIVAAFLLWKNRAKVSAAFTK